jgi:3-oxoacyl-[acyl-carrier-protein] synthase-3
MSIIGVGSYLPYNRFENEQLEAMRIPGVDAGWTKEKLNIKTRRLMGNFTKHSPYGGWVYVYPDNPVRFMAIEAAEDALEDAGVDGKDIDLIIVGTTTAESRSPSVACHVAAAIGSGPWVPAFDVSAACAGFGYALNIASKFDVERALVIGADAYSIITDWNDRNCVFFGDGAGAVVINKGFMETTMGSSGIHADAWYIENDIWRMDGKEVWELAVRGILEAVVDVTDKAGVKVDEIDIVIPHQPGIGVLVEAAKELRIPFEKVHTVMDKYANTASASVPIALHDALKQDKIKEGDLVCLVTVGAGWVWSATLLRWT